MSEVTYRVVTDIEEQTGELEEAHVAKMAREVSMGMRWARRIAITPHHHGTRRLESGVYRIVTDLTVDEAADEAAVLKVAADNAMTLRWALVREHREVTVRMNHGVRRLAATQPPQAASPPSSGGPTHGPSAPSPG